MGRFVIDRGNLVETPSFTVYGEPLPVELHYKITPIAGAPLGSGFQTVQAVMNEERGERTLVVGDPVKQATLYDYHVANEPTAESKHVARIRELGFRAGAAGKPSKPPKDFGSDDYHEWKQAHSEGKEARARVGALMMDIRIEYEHEDAHARAHEAGQGPYIGPKGGKWADPAHTIPWKPVKKSLGLGFPVELLRKSLPAKERREVHGLGIAIENPKGSVRKWRDSKTGESGETTIKTPYGYIEGTKGADGEEIDVFVGPHPDSDKVFIVNQRRVDDYRRFDEHKVILGCLTLEEARRVYLDNYDKKGPKMLGSIRVWSVERFKRWLKSRGKKSEPVSKAHA